MSTEAARARSRSLLSDDLKASLKPVPTVGPAKMDANTNTTCVAIASNADID